MSKAKTVTLECRGNIAELSMNRPEVLNAQDVTMIDDLEIALTMIEASMDIHAVIISGKGRAFSSGIDLKALSEGNIPTNWFRRFDDAVRRLEQLDILTVAKIHGFALGGGLMVALACDLRITTLETRFGFPAVREGLIPGMGTYRLPRFIGLGRARKLIVTGQMIDSEEALRIGLVDWVTPHDAIDEMTESIVVDGLAGSVLARKYSKRLMNASFESSFEEGFSNLIDYQSQCLSSIYHEDAMTEYRLRKSARRSP